MNKDILKEILYSKSEQFSLSDIEQIMNDELEKPADEMDTDLVDRCLDILESHENEIARKKPLKLKITKVLVAAVIFTLVIAASIPVCAKHFNVNIPDGIVQFYNNRLHINISNDEYVDDIVSLLERDGFDDWVLPNELLTPDTKITDYKTSKNQYIKSSSFKFKSTSYYGFIIIENSNFANQEILSDNCEIVKTLKNGTDVLICNTDDCYILKYSYNEFYYNISIYSDYETALKIAKSI